MSVVLIALVGLGLVWLVTKAVSNSRHSPPTKLRDTSSVSGGPSLPDLGFEVHYNEDVRRTPRDRRRDGPAR